MADDTFGSLLELCEYSSSQEDRLRRLPFAGELEDSLPEDSQDFGGIPVETTGIVMVSPPESSKDDDFQTPPEESLLANSDEQRSMAFDRRTDQNIGGVPNDDAVAVGAGCVDGDKTVDLGEDSDLEFSEVKLAQGIDAVRLSEGSECQSKKVRVLERGPPSEDKDSGDAPLKKVKLSEEKLGSETPKSCVGIDTENSGDDCKSVEIVDRNELALTETSDKGILGKTMDASGVLCNGDTEVVETESEEEQDTVKVDSPMEDTEEAVGHVVSGREVFNVDELRSNGEGDSCPKNTDDIEKFKGVEGRRGLPLSICGQPEAENAEWDLGSDPLTSKKRLVTDIQLVLTMLSKGRDDNLANVDVLDILKTRGMTLPQPRWWRAGGYRQG